MHPFIGFSLSVWALTAYASAAVPFAVIFFAAKGAEAGWKAARQAAYRHTARIDREFAKHCTDRLRGLRGAAPSVWRRALRELARERAALDAERETLSDAPCSAARRERARRRRDEAWNAWFVALERSVAGCRTPPRELLARNPMRRGAPIRRLCSFSVHEPPTTEEVYAQYEKARGRGRVEEKIRLGSMLLDAEAAVDSSLVRDENGEIVGRKAGLRGWIADNCPALMKHYAVLMGYRRLAAEFRDAHDLADPCPAALLLDEEPATERKLPPKQRAALPAARRLARDRLKEPEVATVKAFAEKLQRSWAEPRYRTRRLA
ncbi:MAG: hypothetical protein II839_06750 [Kiritimatiellae bacterium]|nr:hypothetical protein [Kiritimatiellia bacterium]